MKQSQQRSSKQTSLMNQKLHVQTAQPRGKPLRKNAERPLFNPDSSSSMSSQTPVGLPPSAQTSAITQQTSDYVIGDAQEDIFSNVGASYGRAKTMNNFFNYPSYNNPFSSEESMSLTHRDVSPPVRQRNRDPYHNQPQPVSNLTSRDLMHMSVEEIIAAANTPTERRGKKKTTKSRSPMPQQQPS